jgi:hypothetical protein
MADASAAYGSLPFKEQIAFFRRKLNLPTASWTDIWQAAHDHAFVVAGANRIDLVQDFRAAIDQAISEGTTLAQFRKDFDAIVAKHGWSYNGGRNWRSRVIYETNLRSSYAAGRYAQLQALKKTLPFWRYRHSDSVMHPRLMHLAWNGLVLSADDPWWQTHFTPNGWGCECTIEGLDEMDLQDLGKSGPDTAPPVDMQTITVGVRGPTPRTVETPAGVDPGFGYAPGRSAWERQQAANALATVQAQDAVAWQPIIPRDAVAAGRSTQLPTVPAPVPLDPPQTTADATVQALRELLGADSRVFDVKGVPVIVDAQTVGAQIDLAQASYLPLLLDLLADPYEVWMQPEQAAGFDVTRVRMRIVKGYDLGHGRTVLIVAEQQDGALVDMTVVPTDDPKAIDPLRSGMLWFGAKSRKAP